jgi:hypothetical protein
MAEASSGAASAAPSAAASAGASAASAGAVVGLFAYASAASVGASAASAGAVDDEHESLERLSLFDLVRKRQKNQEDHDRRQELDRRMGVSDAAGAD